ncbi:MAG TPA: ParB/RepB/Spo0J family partition protein [Acidobacteriota bacterium]|nr:ParB/RepB/Spo0J family partition protein [Acidobacteriota bacterium]HNC44166.1 ParB/RepB/Spo0J family partition protein [Acidobacteriota bacterium]HNH81571.1 ParB/RepB/Spo0J family partition protein [Acidobacteriota bacterium]
MTKKFVPRTDPSQTETLAARVRSSLAGEHLVRVPLHKIKPNPHQPRTTFTAEDLVGLVDSIKVHGILEPLVGVYDTQTDMYTLIAGHRRYEAAREANLDTVPIILRQAEERDFLALALVENLQRENIHPVDEARALRELVEVLGSQEQAAHIISIPRATLANHTRVLALGDQVLNLCRQNPQLSYRNLFALLKVPEAKRLAAAQLLAQPKPADDLAPHLTPEPAHRANRFEFRGRLTSTKGAFRVQVSFRRKEASRDDLILALEQYLDDLRRPQN